jgi:CPA2 family monovalent cation:H+ antiporter-2
LTLDSPAVGQSLAELNLRGRTGATVVALARGDARIVFPEATTRFFAGDLVALTGSQDAIRAAKLILEEPHPDPRLGPTVEFQVPRAFPGAGRPGSGQPPGGASTDYTD